MSKIDKDADDAVKDEAGGALAALFPLVIRASERKGKDAKKSKLHLVFNEEDAKAAFDSIVPAVSQRAVIFHFQSRPSLMTREEVPEWVIKSEEELQLDPEEQARVELEEYGSGKRKRKEVTYHDNLTDRQFMRIVEKEQDIGEAIAKKQERGKNKKEKAARKSLEEAAIAADGKSPMVGLRQ